jgi:hypothetical protein
MDLPEQPKPCAARAVNLENFRHMGVALWAAFLAAGFGAMLATVWIDPTHLIAGESSPGLMPYSLVFLFLWLICALASLLTAWLVRRVR